MSFLNGKYVQRGGAGARMERDTETLLEDEAEENMDHLKAIREIVEDVLTNHLKLFLVVCDSFCVLVFTAILLSVSAMHCEHQPDEVVEWCVPFVPVDRIVVDLNFSLLVHCDEPRSCVAYAENAMESQGFNYNFILGDEDLVYVGKGYQRFGRSFVGQCWSDALRLQMLITRYTWDPKEPIYRVPQEVVIRYSEVIQEGIDCGFILPNFTVSTSCSVYGEFCGASNIRALPWDRPGPLAGARRDRYGWVPPAHSPYHPFSAFDTDRVYERSYRLRACNSSRSELSGVGKATLPTLPPLHKLLGYQEKR